MTEKNTPKVCAYVMTVDSGLAPNPFHGICTLAVCTPNHMRANLRKDDWIVGIAGSNLRKKLGHPDQWRIVYAMKIDEKIGLDKYYNDIKYKKKIPQLTGSRIEMCGDNFYKLIQNELKHTGQTQEHVDVDVEKQDTRGDRVFIGKDFFYFGSLAIELPHDKSWSEFIVRKFQKLSMGIRYLHGGSSADQWNKVDLQDFLEFLQNKKLNHIPAPTDFPHRENDIENISHPKCS